MFQEVSSRPNSTERNWKPTARREMLADSPSPVASHPVERYQMQAERRGFEPVGLVGLGWERSRGGRSSRCQFLFEGFDGTILVFNEGLLLVHPSGHLGRGKGVCEGQNQGVDVIELQVGVEL